MRVLRIVLPFAILGGAIALGWYFIATRPEPRQRPPRLTTPYVDVVAAKREDYTVILKSQGTVRARTQSALVTEVRGRIMSIFPNFREGGFFEEGEVLLEVDPSDYVVELSVAQASLAQAVLEEEEEKARYEQARWEWERLELDAPSRLTLREPHFVRAQANVAAAQARVKNARRNLERTRIRAPFAGRVLTKSVDVGQYVSQGNPLARIYAVDFAEVRLPLTETQLAFIDLQEVYRGDTPDFPEGPPVMLHHTVAGEIHRWYGRIVRAEGSIDTQSRQLFVIAQIRNPYGRTQNGRPPLKVGTFVMAEITGKALPQVFVLPRKLLHENRYVLTVDTENLLRRKNVSILWEDEDNIVVGEGIWEGDRLNLTNLPLVLEGLPVVARMLDKFPVAGEVITDAEASPPPHRWLAAETSGGPGAFVARMMENIPNDTPLPDTLKQTLDDAVSSGDRQAIQVAMQELRDWAETQGINLPGGRGAR